MAEQSCLVSLLGPLPDQTTSLHTLLLNLEAQARIVNEKVGKIILQYQAKCSFIRKAGFTI